MPAVRAVPGLGMYVARTVVNPRGQLRGTRQLVAASPLVIGTFGTVRVRLPRVNVKVTRPVAARLESETS